MKSSSRILAIIALFLTVSFTAFAQRGERKAPNPEKKAEKQTAQMVKALQLDEAQTSEVQAINLTYAKKMHEAMEGNKEAREAMKKIKDAINSEKNAEMKAVLNEEQYKSYQVLKKKHHPRREGPRDGK